MLLLQGNDDLTMVELLMSTDSNSEVAEYAQMVWAGKPGVSSFVSEFLKRKVQELNRKSGGKKKKGGAAPAASLPTQQPSGGISAAAMGLVSAAEDDAWNKIPKKAGAAGKKKKGAKLDGAMLGFTSKLDIALLQSDE